MPPPAPVQDRGLLPASPYGGHLGRSPLLFEGGEQLKNDPRRVKRLQQAIHSYGLCRHSYVTAIGGGALIDMAGFAAATAHRGLRLIRVPTTVMAQADAAIGVKNGINALPQKERHRHPRRPPGGSAERRRLSPHPSPRDWIGGVAEAVKVALIKDADFSSIFWKRHALNALAHRDLDLMHQVIYRSAAFTVTTLPTGRRPF